MVIKPGDRGLWRLARVAVRSGRGRTSEKPCEEVRVMSLDGHGCVQQRMPREEPEQERWWWTLDRKWWFWWLVVPVGATVMIGVILILTGLLGQAG